MKVYFAADHAGFELKQILLNFVRGELGLEVEDCGAFVQDIADDYPDFIGSAAKKLSDDVRHGLDNRAIVLGASGQGEAIAANRHRGVRCALYYGAPSVQQSDASGKKLSLLISSREHNDANALSLAARFLTQEEAVEAVREWLHAPFSKDERHVRRIKKLDLFGN